MPHNIIAEQLMLGALLINNEEINKISDFLASSHFYMPIHQKIFLAIQSYFERGIIATPVTLKNYFDNEQELQALGGITYLAKLTNLATTIVNVLDHGKIIYDLYIRRKLIELGQDVVSEAFKENLEITPSNQIEQ